MHIEILPLIKSFSKSYYLVGGTAIALQIGHRRSIDFDLFSYNNIKRNSLKNNLQKYNIKYTTLLEDSEQLHVVLNDAFNNKLFRQQLSYFKDIYYSDAVEWVAPEVSEEEIKAFLIDVALTPF